MASSRGFRPQIKHPDEMDRDLPQTTGQYRERGSHEERLELFTNGTACRINKGGRASGEKALAVEIMPKVFSIDLFQM